jgi:hypothetical protein
VIYDDIRGYHTYGVDGIIEDGSQRSFFPNGFAFYVYGLTLFDINVDFEELKKDYFACAYGDLAEDVIKIFEDIDERFGNEYLNGMLSTDLTKGKYYNPELCDTFKKAIEVIDGYMPFVNDHLNSRFRAQTVSMRILRRFLQYCIGLAESLVLKAAGEDEAAAKFFRDFLMEFGKYELEIERYYDHELVGRIIDHGVFGATYPNTAVFVS